MTQTILAVDDSASMRHLIEYTLKRAGFQVVLAYDGQEALEKARSQTFDLVLTDYHMPRMDGLQLIRALRAEEKYQSTPLLVLSTSTSNEATQKGRHAGATGYMFKPIAPEKLVEVIKKVIG